MKHTFALFFYQLLMLLLSPILLMALVIRSHNNKAYRQRLLERLGFLSSELQQNSIVIHAASVGEVLALKPLVNQLLAQYPAQQVTFTTFTPTGSAQVIQQFGDRVQHCYLPIDNPVSTFLFLQKLAPKCIVLMETELWPTLISQTKSRHIPLQLVNGRLSDNSMKSYRKLTWLISPCLKKFDHILCQSQDNQANFITLGAPEQSTTVSGNLKYDIRLTEQIIEKQQHLKSFIKTERPIWLLASTHPGDEALTLEAYTQIQAKHPELLLILVPRHPERFDEIATLCQQRFKTVRRSTEQTVEGDDNIWLLDTLGELMAAFALADIVTMGGSFSDVGGHNPLEPAYYQKPIIVGPNMSNFKEVMLQMRKYQSVIELTSQTDLASQLTNQVLALIASPERRIALGKQARNVVDKNQGATALTIKKISQYLK